MRVFLVFLSLFFLQTAFAQKRIRGVVLDEEKNVPVPKASVFLNNTSIGTTANEEGQFELSVPAGRYDLIVSSVGFSTYSQTINGSDAADFLTIKLKIKTPELEAVIIEPFEKDGWQKWGRWFNENFLGTSSYGREAQIKNPEVLKFRNSKKNNQLQVIAIAPLVIESKGLGYRITYQLENFRYDFKTRYILYSGYPFFENLEGSDRKKRQWEKAREDVYYGSMLQFMRAVYSNTIKEEGFEVRRLYKTPNPEKERVRAVYRSSSKANANGMIISTINRDSSDYYSEVMRQDDYQNRIGEHLLAGDSIAYAIDSTIAGLFFTDYLLVTYKHKKLPAEFRQLFPRSGSEMMSEITLINGRPVEVFSNGAYFNPEDLLSSGYWGWWEKMGTMLPFDYTPSEKK